MRRFKPESAFILPLYWWPGLQMGTAGRAAAKKTDTPGLCPASYGESHRQLNSHNGKEYLSFPGKYATKQAPSVPREDRRGQKWAQEPIPADWREFENCGWGRFLCHSLLGLRNRPQPERTPAPRTVLSSHHRCDRKTVPAARCFDSAFLHLKRKDDS